MKKSSIIIFFTLFGIVTYAQKFNHKTDSRQIIVNKSDTVIEANIFIGRIRNKPDIGRTYFWYANGEINSNDGGYRGMLLNGDYKEIVNNKLVTNGGFRKGSISGDWRKWYPSGKLMEVTSWSRGAPKGTHYKYNEDGSLREAYSYKKKYLPKIFHKKQKGNDNNLDYNLANQQ